MTELAYVDRGYTGEETATAATEHERPRETLADLRFVASIRMPLSGHPLAFRSVIEPHPDYVGHLPSRRGSSRDLRPRFAVDPIVT